MMFRTHLSDVMDYHVGRKGPRQVDDRETGTERESKAVLGTFMQFSPHRGGRGGGNCALE